MAETTKIEWCDHSFNPWVGCTKISPACDHCYAESWANRTGHPELWSGERRRTTYKSRTTTISMLLLVAICAPGQIRTLGRWIAPNEHGEIMMCDKSGKWVEMPHPKTEMQK